jgi:hypothetical protein
MHYQTTPITSIATLPQFSPEAFAMLTNLTEARPLIRIELNVKSFDGGQLNLD